MKRGQTFKVSIKDIPLEGYDISDELGPGVVGKRELDDFHFIKPLKVRVHVTQTDGMIFADTHVESEFSVICSRCLATSEQPWTMDATINVEVKKSQHIVDLAEDIRQEVILNFPENVLCKADCKGICSQCGLDLNEGQCDCKIEEVEQDTSDTEVDTYQPFANLDIEETDS